MRPTQRGVMRTAAMLAAVAVLFATTGPSLAADPVAFGTPSARTSFGQGVTFEQPIEIAAPIARAELLLTYPGSIGPLVIEVAPPTRGATTLHHREEAKPGELIPGTRLDARWRLTGTDDREYLGPAVATTYADDRFDWRTKTSGLVRFHWYDGDDAFADRALAIAVDGLAAAEDLFGVRETEPVDFYAYASRDAIYDALAPDRENVGGQAYPSLRTLFGRISPSGIRDSWVPTVVRHEIAHLVFDTATRNPHSYPPKWLDEGLATYLAQGYSPDDRAAVERAAGDGTLLPLDAIAGQFPTSGDRFGLAYAESVAAVDFIVRSFGQPAIGRLIDAYSEGLADDEAFRRAIGRTPAEIDRDWRAELGASQPTVHGPRPAEPGPVPEGWDTVFDPSVPVASAPAEPSRPNSSLDNDRADGADVLTLALAVTVAAALIGGLVMLRRGSRRTSV